MCQKTAVWVANSVDPDQMLHSAAPDLSLEFLLRPNCLNRMVDIIFPVMTI